MRYGIIQGYLAYYNGQAVGWCNANTKSDCMYCISWLRFMQSLNVVEPDSNSKVKSIFCFVIKPEMQRKGIATQLLERVCNDAISDGFDVVEVYPKKEFVSVARDFMGPAAMYSKYDFHVYAELEDNEIIMRKHLK